MEAFNQSKDPQGSPSCPSFVSVSNNRNIDCTHPQKRSLSSSSSENNQIYQSVLLNPITATFGNRPRSEYVSRDARGFEKDNRGLATFLTLTGPATTRDVSPNSTRLSQSIGCKICQYLSRLIKPQNTPKAKTEKAEFAQSAAISSLPNTAQRVTRNGMTYLALVPHEDQNECASKEGAYTGRKLTIQGTISRRNTCHYMLSSPTDSASQAKLNMLRLSFDGPLNYGPLLGSTEDFFAKTENGFRQAPIKVTTSSTLLQGVTLNDVAQGALSKSALLPSAIDTRLSDESSNSTSSCSDREISMEGVFPVVPFEDDDLQSRIGYRNKPNVMNQSMNGSSISFRPIGIFADHPNPPKTPAPCKPLPALPLEAASFRQYRKQRLTTTIKNRKDLDIKVRNVDKSLYSASNSRIDKRAQLPFAECRTLQPSPEIKTKSEILQAEIEMNERSRKKRVKARKIRDLQMSKYYRTNGVITPLPSPEKTRVPVKELPYGVFSFAEKAKAEDKAYAHEATGSESTVTRPVQLSIGPIMLVAEQCPVTCIVEELRDRTAELVLNDNSPSETNTATSNVDSDCFSTKSDSTQTAASNLTRAPKQANSFYSFKFPAPPSRAASNKTKPPLLILPGLPSSNCRPELLSWDEGLGPKATMEATQERCTDFYNMETKRLKERIASLERQTRLLQAALTRSLKVANKSKTCSCNEHNSAGRSLIGTWNLGDHAEPIAPSTLDRTELFLSTRSKIDRTVL